MKTNQENTSLMFAVVMIVFIAWSIFTLAIVSLQGIKINELEKEVATARSELYETNKHVDDSEERCKRMTDTCIDIISNRRWE